MSRHRNFRSMNYEEECYDDDDDYDGYSQSYDDKYCVSPGTAAQFTFPREHSFNLGSYISPLSQKTTAAPQNNTSKAAESSNHSEAALSSCLDYIHNVIGDLYPDADVVKCILKHNYDQQVALNELLSTSGAPKPQRQPRQNKRSQAAAKKEAGTSLDYITIATPKPSGNVGISKSEGMHMDSVEKLKPKGAQKKRQEKLSVLPATNSTPVVADKLTSTELSIARDLFGQAISSTETNGSALTGTENGVDEDNLEAAGAQNGGDYGERLNVRAQRKEGSVERPMGLPKSGSRSKYERVDLKKAYEKRQGGKMQINLVVIGHVDAGKSTLMGHLLYQLGQVNKKVMHKHEQESRKVGKGSFAFAWVLDETEEERSRGVTMDIAQTRFETPHKIITLLDAPGHKDFIPNMIMGTAQADVAILVVNSTRGEFETGFESGGQTREHALLARSLGVSQVIVAVNKMDTIDWSEERYKEVVKKLGQFLKQAGYRDRDISFIPCSGLYGENLNGPVKEPKLAAWYKEKTTLVMQIDNFRCMDRPIDKPFRLCISDVFKGMGSGFSVSGKIGSGAVQNGDKVLLMPSGEMASVKCVTIDDELMACGFAGDHVNLTLLGVDMNIVSIGNFVCDVNNPIKSTIKLRAKVVIFNIEVPITRGYPAVIHYQSVSEPVVFKRLIGQLNKSTGEIIKNRPKCLVKNISAIVEIEFERPFCIELYKEYKDLGRFMLRNGGKTIAAGLVEELL